MPNDPERYLTLRQADQARTDFAIIEDELEAIYARLHRVAEPRRAVACLPYRNVGRLGAHDGFGFRARRALMPAGMTKFVRMILEAAVMAVLAGSLTLLLTRA
jgi:hypothetical protein